MRIFYRGCTVGQSLTVQNVCCPPLGRDRFARSENAPRRRLPRWCRHCPPSRAHTNLLPTHRPYCAVHSGIHPVPANRPHHCPPSPRSFATPANWFSETVSRRARDIITTCNGFPAET